MRSLTMWLLTTITAGPKIAYATQTVTISSLRHKSSSKSLRQVVMGCSTSGSDSVAEISDAVDVEVISLDGARTVRDHMAAAAGGPDRA